MSNAVVDRSIDGFSAVVRTKAPSIQLRDDVASFAVDGMAPGIAVAPRTLTELQLVLTEAGKAGLACIAIGGGEHSALANVPERFNVAISTGGLREIIEYEAADLTVTVQAGLRLAELQALLATHGQFLPLDPPSRAFTRPAQGSAACGRGAAATIGGVLAANAYGPLRHAYGTARDWLIGLRVVQADGSTTKSGGRVVKNVAGYDMHKLHIGALGTLGVIAEATFKLAPLPRVTSTLAIQFDSPIAASLLLFAARDAGLAIEAAELLSPPATHAVLDIGRWVLLVRVAGGEGAVARTMRELGVLASGAGTRAIECDALSPQGRADVWTRWSAVFAPTAASLALRVAVMPSDVASTIELLDRQFVGASARISATIAAGAIRCMLKPAREADMLPLIERARDLADRAGGTVVVDAAPLEVKREIDVFGPTRADFAIMSRLKQQFDPNRLLAPGRFVGRL